MRAQPDCFLAAITQVPRRRAFGCNERGQESELRPDIRVLERWTVFASASRFGSLGLGFGRSLLDLLLLLGSNHSLHRVVALLLQFLKLELQGLDSWLIFRLNRVNCSAAALHLQFLHSRPAGDPEVSSFPWLSWRVFAPMCRARGDARAIASDKSRISQIGGRARKRDIIVSSWVRGAVGASLNTGATRLMEGPTLPGLLCTVRRRKLHLYVFLDCLVIFTLSFCPLKGKAYHETSICSNVVVRLSAASRGHRPRPNRSPKVGRLLQRRREEPPQATDRRRSVRR